MQNKRRILMGWHTCVSVVYPEYGGKNWDEWTLQKKRYDHVHKAESIKKRNKTSEQNLRHRCSYNIAIPFFRINGEAKFLLKMIIWFSVSLLVSANIGWESLFELFIEVNRKLPSDVKRN